MFVLRAPAGPSSATYLALQAALAAWFKEAYAAGLKRESIEALIAATYYQITSGREVARNPTGGVLAQLHVTEQYVPVKDNNGRRVAGGDSSV